MEPKQRAVWHKFFVKPRQTLRILLASELILPCQSKAFYEHLPVAIEATAGNSVYVRDLTYLTGYGIRTEIEFFKNFCGGASLTYLYSDTLLPVANIDLCPNFGWWHPRVGGRLSYFNAQQNIDNWFGSIAKELAAKPIWIGFSYEPLRFQFKQFRISLFEVSTQLNIFSESAWKMNTSTAVTLGWQYTSL